MREAFTARRPSTTTTPSRTFEKSTTRPPPPFPPAADERDYVRCSVLGPSTLLPRNVERGEEDPQGRFRHLPRPPNRPTNTPARALDEATRNNLAIQPLKQILIATERFRSRRGRRGEERRRRMAAEVIACHTKEEFYSQMEKAKEAKKLVRAPRFLCSPLVSPISRALCDLGSCYGDWWR